jgi:hypothetical protein
MLHDVEHGYEVELAVSCWDVLARPHPKRHHPLVETSPLREAACLLHDRITDLDPDDRFRPVLEKPDRPAAVAAAEVENRLAAEKVRSVEPPVKRPLRFARVLGFGPALGRDEDRFAGRKPAEQRQEKSVAQQRSESRENTLASGASTARVPPTSRRARSS